MEIRDGLAIIRLNDPARPVNVISAGCCARWARWWSELENGEGGVRAAVIISEKKGTWIAGADIEEFKHFQIRRRRRGRQPRRARAAGPAGAPAHPRRGRHRRRGAGRRAGDGPGLHLPHRHGLAQDEDRPAGGEPGDHPRRGRHGAAAAAHRAARGAGPDAYGQAAGRAPRHEGRHHRRGGAARRPAGGRLAPGVGPGGAHAASPRGAPARLAAAHREPGPHAQADLQQGAAGGDGQDARPVPRPAAPAQGAGARPGQVRGRGAGAGGQGVRRAGGDAGGALARARLLHQHGGQERSRAGDGRKGRRTWTRSPSWAPASWARGSRPRRPRRASACA